MKKKLFIASIVAIPLLVAGCSHTQNAPAQNAPATNSESSPDSTKPTNTDVISTPESDGHIVKPAESRVSVKNINSFKIGKNTIAFELFGIDGHEFGDTDLRTVHDKKLHLILVRDDMNGFMHVHPEYKNSEWSTEATFNLSGSYNMYLDFDALEEKPTVLRLPFTVDTKKYTEDFPSVTIDMLSEVGGYTAKLTTGSSIKTKETVKLDYMITKNGEPVENIKPYLGAFGHVVMFRQTDVDDYFHVHAIEGQKPVQGKIQFETEFPLTGRYTIFGQFNLDDTIVTFPITIDVTEEGAGASSTNHTIH